MNSIIYAFLMVLLWIANLLNNTGLGNAYHTTEYVRMVVVVLTIVVLSIKIKREGGLKFPKNDFVSFALLALVFITVPYFKGKGYTGIDYLWIYLLVYLLSKLRISKSVIKFIGICYGLLGIIILYIYNFCSLLDGWNENTIAMIGLYSFFVFIIPYYSSENIYEKAILILATGVISYLLYPTDSRSCIMFAIVSVLFAFSIIPKRIVIYNYKTIIMWLLVPLFISILVSLVSGTEIANNLNIWSYEQFQKPIFNGRDLLWIEGFQRLMESPLFGEGRIYGGYWHNCAITCLTAYGIIGFILWINSLYRILKKAFYWLNDSIVVGCIISFILLLAQQSVELGLFGANPNLIPYIILGLMLGRIRYLESFYGVVYAEN